MWKFIPKGIRDTLERGLNIHRKSDTRVARNKKTLNCYILEGLKGITCGSSGCDQSKKQGSYCNEKNWFTAFSCSSALALGWVLSQPCIWKRRLYNDKPTILKKLNLAEQLAVVAFLQPNNGKEALANCVHSDSVIYGPKTAEEAFQEGIEEFSNVHNTIWAEIENAKGMACIASKDNNEAFKHFMHSSKLGYPPAEYNIALCYERGIGIKQDFAKAAKWYEKAASNGHTTAMYNLGVFYAHGWGGLEESREKAKNLFIQAAEKGEPHATAALGRQDKVDNKLTESPPKLEEGHVSHKMDNDSGINVDLSNDIDNLLNLSSINLKDDCKSVQSGLLHRLYKVSSNFGTPDAKSIMHTYEFLQLIDGKNM
ncbi:uncharacterized protein LOC106665065 [Cimex lectularius]|uniref:HCP-like protein n=1 Tax=Cimex lectularius TaxID=79782 RepID=A0A8I6RKA8_CIMLE|nr:uncharacterized protein LOC106665065 [Cimex lectularius]